MEFRILAYAVAALSFAGVASAQQRLGDLEMDAVTAGLAPSTSIDCPACAVASSTSASMNGVTIATSGTASPGGGSSDSKATNTDTAAGGTAGPAVLVGAVPVPPAVAATLNAASVAITRN
jgi:hypothetical protein